MAVDDILNDVSDAATEISLQPASGVEVIITSFSLDNQNTQAIRFNDGTQTSTIASTNSPARS